MSQNIPTIHKPMNDERLSMMEAGIRAHHQTVHDLEQALNALRETEIRLRAAEVEIEGLRGQLADADARISAARLEMEQAISERAVLEGLFALVKRTLDLTELPAPLMHKRLQGALLKASEEDREARQSVAEARLHGGQI